MNKKAAPPGGGTETILMKYKHIIFDVDGTLLDTAYCILYSLREALLAATGSSPEIEDMTHVLGRTSLANMEHFGITDQAEEVVSLWVANEEKNSHMMRPFEGIPELLDALRDAGVELGIVTSRTHEEMDLVLNPLPERSYFSTAVCSDDTDEHKPSPAPLFKYMELTGAKSEEMLYVGDSPGDEKCATSAGVDFALAVWGTHAEGIPATYYPETPQALYEEIAE